MITLRDYQTQAIDVIRALILSGVLRIIVLSPTGSGKTIIAVFVIKNALERGKKILFVAHRVELINQTVTKLIEAGIPEDQIGVIRSSDKRTRPNAPVQVASIDSLKALPRADIVIIDEAHRSAAASYAKLFADYPEAIILGLTATPARLDGKPLDMYQQIVRVATPRQLVEEGHIVAPLIFTVPEELLPQLGHHRKKWSQQDADAAVMKKKIIGGIVEHWKQRAEGRRTIGFASVIEHSQLLVSAFREAGIRAEHADGSMSETERKAIVRRLVCGETQVVWQCDLWTEGVDLPMVKCGIFARPTDSLVIYLQACGRLMRPFNGEIPLILDHAGNAQKFGSPLEEREYSLKGKLKTGPSLAKTCPACFAIIDRIWPQCPQCGHVFGGERAGRQAPPEIQGNLVEMNQDERSLQQQYWNRLAKECVRMGYKPGWAAHQFKQRFGVFPPRAWAFPQTEKPTERDDQFRRQELHKLRTVGFKSGKPLTWANERYEIMFGESAEALLRREQVLQADPVNHGSKPKSSGPVVDLEF